MVLLPWLNTDEGLGPEWRKLTRICGCVGWAVHGVIFEYGDEHHRSGILQDNDGRLIPTLDDGNIAARSRGFNNTWRNVTNPGDYIVRITGHQLEGRLPPPYLCHTLNLIFASGQTIRFTFL